MNSNIVFRISVGEKCAKKVLGAAAIGSAGLPDFDSFR